MRTRPLSVLVCLLLAAGAASAQLETFDGATIGTSSCGTTTTGFPYNGWANDLTVGTGNLSWIIDNNGTGSSGTGPSGDLCGTGNYVFIETSCSGAGPWVAGVLSPVWDASLVITPTLSFYYHMLGATMGTLEVQASDGVGGWTSIFMLSGNQGDAWVNAQVPCPTFDVGMGPQAQVRFVGTRGTSFTGDACFDQVWFGDPPTPPIPPLNQPNVPTASLAFTGGGGAVCQPGVVPAASTCLTPLLPAPLIQPEIQAIAPSGLSTMTVGTGANAFAPYTIFATPGFGAVSGPGAPTPMGIVDLDPAGWGSLVTLIDGIAGTTGVDQWLGTTLGNGQRVIDIVLPSAGPGGTPYATFQGLVIDPTSPNPGGFQITAATEFDYPFALSGTPVGSMDDSSIQIVFTGGFTFPFYGAVYSDVYVESNGYLTFGGPDFDVTETAAEMLGGLPRIAGAWDDLDPETNGYHTYVQGANSFLTTWGAVPQFSIADSNNFAIAMTNLGDVTIEWWGMGLADTLAGISPGGADPVTLLPYSPVGVATGASLDLSSLVIGIGYTGAPTEAIFEAWTSGFDLGGTGGLDLCTGFGGLSTQLQFTPNAGAVTPGDTGYFGI